MQSRLWLLGFLAEDSVTNFDGVAEGLDYQKPGTSHGCNHSSYEPKALRKSDANHEDD